jgi:hypothetical protein
MRLKTRWLLVSLGGALLIAAILLFVSIDTPFLGVGADMPGSAVTAGKVVLWPVAVCLYVAGPGPSIGPPEKHLHEWTPVQDFAVVAGIGLSWVFYSSAVFVLIWLQQKRRLAKAINS